MAYKNYKSTWLSKLPYEIQDEINKHYNKEIFKDVMTELFVETTNDIPLSNVLNLFCKTGWSDCNSEKALGDITCWLIVNCNQDSEPWYCCKLNGIKSSISEAAE